ncbi:hypothetical protein AB0K12_28445 [Nonomuraea sp. NPDC049419]|uniref:hypothetical protein n=1 Tax=Nonomuraea sp. NPDC049419 TaxID=3155772 RepID=UPI0034180756
MLSGTVTRLAAFVAVQARRREPLMRLSIFRTPNLAAYTVADRNMITERNPASAGVLAEQLLKVLP